MKLRSRWMKGKTPSTGSSGASLTTPTSIKGATSPAPRAMARMTPVMMPGSARAERFLFWPMGIASAGAMRQWGRHATAFVGRRHFDDADLFERRFRFER